ncbi:MAG TPA: 50S ribosomal protein L10 [Candidatus Nanoarchaeia archaeon]|nr:50S ribosomal protein L10 [Candidatus Nanoarchaeia archaeon]
MRAQLKLKVGMVDELVTKLSKAKIICAFNLQGLPAAQLKDSRKWLKGELVIKPKNILKRALEKLGNGFKELGAQLNGSYGLLLSNVDPFKLSIELTNKRIPAFVKEGMIAKNDITLEAGPTSLMPGPAMTDLTSLGVKVSPKGGKLTITDPATIVKAGNAITKKVSDLLFKLNIKPITTGIDLIAAIEDGVIFSGEHLIVNVEAIMNLLMTAYNGALNLSYNTGIVNKLTIELLLRKAFSEASNLAREACIIGKDNAGDLMLIAKAKALALASVINLEVRE